VFVCITSVGKSVCVCVIQSLCKSTVVCKAYLYVWACLYVKMFVSILLPVSPSFHLSLISPSFYVPTFHNMSAPCLFIFGIIVYFYIYVSCYKIFIRAHLSLCSSTLSGHPSSSFLQWLTGALGMGNRTPWILTWFRFLVSEKMQKSQIQAKQW
jgi:hypothetical protein